MDNPLSCSLHAQKVALRVIEEDFGGLVKTVAHYLLMRGGASLAEMKRHFKEQLEQDPSSITTQELKDSLCILIQHNILDVKMPTEDEMAKSAPHVHLKYFLKADEACLRVRFPWFCAQIEERYGALGAAVLEELMAHGRLTLQQAKEDVAAQLLAEEDAAAGEAGAVPSYERRAAQEAKIQGVFEALIQGRYIVKVNPLDLATPSPAPEAAPVSASRLALQKSLFGPSLTQSGRDAAAGGAAGRRGGAGGAGAGAAATHGQVRVRKRKTNYGEEAGAAAPGGPGGGPGGDAALPLELQLMLQQEQLVAKARKGGAAVKAEEPELKRVKLEDGAAEAPAGGGGAPTRGRRRHNRGRGRGRAGAGAGRGEGADGGSAAGANQNGSAAGSGGGPGGGGPGGGGGEWEGNVLARAVWRVGADQFLRDFRHAACARLAGEKLNAAAQQVMAALLRLSAPKERQACEEQSAPASVREIYDALPPRDRPEWGLLTKYLELLRADGARLVAKVAAGPAAAAAAGLLGGAGEGGRGADDGPRYAANLGGMLRFLRQRAIHGMVEDRLGLLSARIFFVLLDKQYLEDTQVGELAMVPARECRARLLRLQREGLAALQEVPKRADRAPGATLYLWTVDARRAQAAAADRLWQALLALKLRRAAEVARHRELLRHADRITDAAEARRAEALGRALDRLDRAIHGVDRTLMLFHAC